MHKIVVIGEMNDIYGFKGLGVEISVRDSKLDTAQELADCVKKFCCKGYGIIYITESIAGKIADEILTYQDRTKPAIVLIPSAISGPNTGLGQKNLRRLVEKAVGSDILK
ncbi:MAG: V-type ATP synthase subunit F [Oscillospiraceae bacterium]|jgi:vacuolar-type H+-ATPase subunit F/Vma7|nr:V-type ATP synthase subunit F [Oscillospiraceae bacterium]